MPRLNAVDPATVTGKTKDMLDAVNKKLGMTPNMMRTMANSPSVLEGYLNFSGALSHGTLGAKTGERIALALASANHCDYCASAHSAIGKMVGLTPDDIGAGLKGGSTDAKADAAVKFARAVVESRGEVKDSDLAAVRGAGFTDGEIGEIVAHVALNVFTNYFNTVAQTAIDFPVLTTR